MNKTECLRAISNASLNTIPAYRLCLNDYLTCIRHGTDDWVHYRLLELSRLKENLRQAAYDAVGRKRDGLQ